MCSDCFQRNREYWLASGFQKSSPAADLLMTLKGEVKKLLIAFRSYIFQRLFCGWEILDGLSLIVLSDSFSLFEVPARRRTSNCFQHSDMETSAGATQVK